MGVSVEKGWGFRRILGFQLREDGGWVRWFRETGEVIRRHLVRCKAVGRVMDFVGMTMGSCDGLMVMDGWVG